VWTDPEVRSAGRLVHRSSILAPCCRRRRCPRWWPVLLAGSCVAAFVHAQPASDEDGQPAPSLPGQRPPAPPFAPGRTPPSAQDVPGTGEAADSGPAPDWRLAPIRWGGNLGLEWRDMHLDAGARRRQTIESVNLRAASFIWQPWFAQVTSTLSLAMVRSQAGGGDGESALVSGGDARSITGSLGLALFPQSRFPFTANYSVADSRSSDVFTVADTRTHRLSLRQGWRSEDGNEQLGATFDRSMLSSSAFGSDTVDVLQATWMRRLQDHQFDASATRTTNSRSSDGGGAGSSRLAMTHTYRRDEDLMVSSTLSDSRARTFADSAGVGFGSRFGFRQLSTLATWTPDTEQPLLVTGAFRWADTSTLAQGGDADAVRSDTRTMSATGTVTWRPTPRLSVGAAGSLSVLSTAGVDQMITSESVSAGYSFDPIQVAGATYVAGLNGGVVHQAGGLAPDRMQSTLAFSHSLNRNLPVSDRSTIGFTLAQTGTARQDTGFGASRTLTHNGSMSLRHLTESGTSGFASLSLGDSRTTGFPQSSFQLLNLQLSGQVPFGRYASASANMTIQRTRQTSDFDPVSGWRTYTSGGASFQHARLFGVPRLRYSAIATAFNAQINARLAGDLDAPRENVAWTHDHRLDYTIGRLDFRLSMRIAKVDGKKNALLFLRVSRSFGAF